MKTVVDFASRLKTYILDKDTDSREASEQIIAPVESDPSTATHSPGAQLIFNDILYDIIDSIAVGDSLVVGTNIQVADKVSVAIAKKQDQMQLSTMPTASASNVGKVVIYIGPTTSTYTSGQSYQSTLEGGNYVWKPTSISSVDASDVTYNNQTSRLTATDAQAAIDELASKNKTLETAISNTILYFSGQACLALTGDFCTISNAEITANHVVAEAVFANPSSIITDVTWTTTSGSLKLNGTCSTATTVNIVLAKKNN